MMLRQTIRCGIWIAVLALVAFALCPSMSADDDAASPPAEAPSLEKKAGDAFDAADRLGSDSADARKAMLNAMRQVATDYPDSKAAGRAARHVRILERMVKEDEAYAKRCGPEQRLPIGEVAERLVYRLRDEGYDVLFHNPPSTVQAAPGNAALQLTKLGYGAIPVLFDHLDDDGIMGHGLCARRDSMPFNALDLRLGSTVGEWCQVILMTIIGSDLGCGVPPEDPAVFEKKAREWWEQLQHNGEWLMLCRGTEAGDLNSTVQAARLAARYPDRAVDSLRAALRHADEPWVHLSLLDTYLNLLDRRAKAQMNSATTKRVGAIIADDAAILLESELKDEDREIRWFAAQELHRRGYARGLTAMIQDWKNGIHESALAKRLARSSSAEAVRALASGLHDAEYHVRQTVVMSIGDARLAKDQHLPSSVRAAMEDVFIAALNDKGGVYGVCSDGTEYRERICDAAAWYVAKLQDPKVPFDFAAKEELRDREIQKLKDKYPRQ